MSKGICFKYGELKIWNVLAEFEYVTGHRSIFTLLNDLGSERSEHVGHFLSAKTWDFDMFPVAKTYRLCAAPILLSTD